MRFLIQVLFVASTVTQSLVKGQQCDCASTVPKCKPLPTQNVGSGTETSCVKVPRSDCPCCLTCAGQLHDTCDPESQPCDIYKGLICDSTSKLCTKGKTCYDTSNCFSILFRFYEKSMTITTN